MQKFGDLFYIDNKEYVWLFSDGKTISAAIILDQEKTREVKRVEETANRKGISHEKPLFCYVELSTENYIDCSANMIATQKDIKLDSEIRRHSNKKLNNDDLKNIRDEILESQTLFKSPLVEYMKSISILK